MTFDQFVASRLAALLRYATVVSCDSHLAEDIVQEVLLRAQRPVEPAGPEVNPGALVPAAGPYGWVHVELDDRRQLFVSLELGTMVEPPELSLEDVVRVAESMRIGPEPDTSWLGRR